jgi:ribosomal protein S18 acetylase RimI-like enzyme
MSWRFIGYVDNVEPALTGWVCDTQCPAEPVRLMVTIDQRRRFEVMADRPRPDVATAGMAGPDCGFELILPADLCDGAPHEIVLTLSDGQSLDFPGWQLPVPLGPVAASIGPITAADLDDVSALLKQTYIEGNMSPDDIASLTDDYVTSWIRQAASADGGVLLGARVGSQLVGYAMLEPGGGRPAIGALALSILRLYRRKGLGERLMRALLADVQRGGKIDEVWLSVEPSNLPARRLYEKLGFVDRAEPPRSLIVPAGFRVMMWRPDRPGR